MPETHRPISPHPSKPTRTIGDAAADNMVATLRCNLCHRKTRFLASDLIQVIDHNHPAHIPPFGCSRCKTKEYVTIKWAVPSSTDQGAFYIRKLKAIRRTPVWEDRLFGQID